METRGTRKNVWHADSKKSHGLGFSKSATKIQKSATKFSWVYASANIQCGRASWNGACQNLPTTEKKRMETPLSAQKSVTLRHQIR